MFFSFFSYAVDEPSGSFCSSPSEVVGNVYTEDNIELKSKGKITGEHCEYGVKILEPTDLIDLPVDELMGEECEGVFKDAAQSHSSGKLTMHGTSVIDQTKADQRVTNFDFNNALITYTESCVAGPCGATGKTSPKLSEYSIPEKKGPTIVAANWQGVDGKNIILGDAGSEEDKFQGLSYESITINSDSSVTFAEQADHQTQIYIGALTIEWGGTLKVTPGVYAIKNFTMNIGSTIELIGDGDVYFFIESTGVIQGDIKSGEHNFFFVSNSTVNLNTKAAFNGAIYSKQDLFLNSSVNIKGKVSAYNLIMNGTSSIVDDSVCSTPPPPEDDYSYTFDGLEVDALTCSIHTVPIQVLLGDVIDEGFTGAISLSTSTNMGDWSIGDGQGTLTPNNNNDGKITYQFSAADKGQVKLGLFHPMAGDVVITVSGNGASNNSPAITFRPFQLKAQLSCDKSIDASCINVANRPFSLTLTAVGEDASTGQCQVIEGYKGIKNLQFWSSYLDPINPAGENIEVNGNEIGKGSAQSTLVQVEFEAGVTKLPLAVNYPDAGYIQLHARDDAGIGKPPAGPNQNDELQGSTSTIVNPLELQITEVKGYKRNADGTVSEVNNPATQATGSGFIRASIPDYGDLKVDTFNVKVTAVKDCSNDPQGHCKNDNIKTPSFSNEIELKASLLFPESGRFVEPSYKGGNGLKEEMYSGMFEYQDLAYQEVGTLGLQTISDNYLLPGNNIRLVDLNTKTKIGRFYPDYLAVNSFNATPACHSDFTYLDQTSISVKFNMQAYAQGGSYLTENYDYNLGYPVAGSKLLLDTSDEFSDEAYVQTLFSLTYRLLRNKTYQPSEWKNGLYNVDWERGIAKTSQPDGPYFAANNQLVDYFIKLSGIDGEKIQPGSTTSCNEGSGDSCKLGALGDLAYGRLQAGNGHGSEFQSIRTRIEATYFDGNHFVPMERDSCTTLNMAQVSATPDKTAPPENKIAVGAGKTKLSILNPVLIAGESRFQFSAPNNTGKLDYFIRLKELSSANLYAPWLLDSGNAVECPDAVGTPKPKDCISGYVEFGLFRSNDRIIYRMQTFE